MVFSISAESRVFKTARVASGKKTGKGICRPVVVLKNLGLDTGNYTKSNEYEILRDEWKNKRGKYGDF